MKPSTQSHDVSPEALALLRDKYAQLIALRQGRVEDRDAALPRAQLRALASMFPGALRELELRTDDELAQRHTQLTNALNVGGPVPAWAPVQVMFHGLLRTALALKRAMAGAPDPLAAARAALAALPRACDVPEPAFWGDPRLRAVAHPASGRLSMLIVSWVAEMLDVSEAEVCAVVLPGKPGSPFVSRSS